jgi:hypothetical protein
MAPSRLTHDRWHAREIEGRWGGATAGRGGEVGRGSLMTEWVPSVRWSNAEGVVRSFLKMFHFHIEVTSMANTGKELHLNGM